MKSEIKRVACYVRVSTENQIENYSIEEQTQRLEAYCKARSWFISDMYTDGGYSGGNTERPALQKMLCDLKDKTINAVVVYKLDRLSRSQKDTLTLIEDEFLSNGVDFISVNENFDTSTAFGKAMVGILAVFAQLEKDQITERFTMGRIGRSKAGYFHGGGNAPIGYLYIRESGELVVDNVKAVQVKEAYDLFLNGKSINAVYRILNDKYGGWSTTSVYNVLKNSVYIGKVKFAKQEHEGIHTPIISASDFYEVQKLLSSDERENKKTSAQKTPFRAGYLLSSLIYCSHCSAKYSANHGYYKCYSRSKNSAKFVKDPNCKNENWEISELDEIVVDAISELCEFSGDALEAFIKKRSQAPYSDRTDKNKIKGRIKEIDKQVNKLIDLYQIDSIDVNELKNRIDSLKLVKKELENELLFENKTLAKGTDFKNGIRDFKNQFQLAPLEQQRLLVSTLIQAIWIDDNNVTIEWRL